MVGGVGGEFFELLDIGHELGDLHVHDLDQLDNHAEAEVGHLNDGAQPLVLVLIERLGMAKVLLHLAQYFDLCDCNIEEAHNLLYIGVDHFRLRILSGGTHSDLVFLELTNDQVLTIICEVKVGNDMSHRRVNLLKGAALFLPSPRIGLTLVPRVLSYLIPNYEIIKMLNILLHKRVQIDVEGLVVQVQSLHRNVDLFTLRVPELAGSNTAQ